LAQFPQQSAVASLVVVEQQSGDASVSVAAPVVAAIEQNSNQPSDAPVAAAIESSNQSTPVRDYVRTVNHPFSRG
jgi:hypothetical protein